MLNKTFPSRPRPEASRPRPRSQANLLNEYFSSVFTNENYTNAPVPKQIFKGNIQSEGLLGIEITEEMVANKLEKLDVNKCPGWMTCILSCYMSFEES